MKTPQNPSPKRRPYDAPMLTRQSNLKSITLFTSSDTRGRDTTDRGGEPHVHDIQ
jgi:hypothetical protein